jgi:hypothetical protein
MGMTWTFLRPSSSSVIRKLSLQIDENRTGRADNGNQVGGVSVESGVEEPSTAGPGAH